MRQTPPRQFPARRDECLTQASHPRPRRSCHSSSNRLKSRHAVRPQVKALFPRTLPRRARFLPPSAAAFRHTRATPAPVQHRDPLYVQEGCSAVSRAWIASRSSAAASSPRELCTAPEPRASWPSSACPATLLHRSNPPSGRRSRARRVRSGMPPMPPEPACLSRRRCTICRGKVAYVTASSDGIGLGIARAASNAGMKVCIGYRNEERLKAALPLFKPGNAGVFPVKHDVTEPRRLGAGSGADQEQVRPPAPGGQQRRQQTAGESEQREARRVG